MRQSGKFTAIRCLSASWGPNWGPSWNLPCITEHCIVLEGFKGGPELVPDYAERRQFLGKPIGVIFSVWSGRGTRPPNAADPIFVSCSHSTYPIFGCRSHPAAPFFVRSRLQLLLKATFSVENERSNTITIPLIIQQKVFLLMQNQKEYY